MITYNELKEKCNCWTGYKRKPGTKPCAEDSCMKEELTGKEKTTGSVSLKSHKVMAFGRMNPITSGHEAVVNKVHEIAKKHNAEHVVIVSHSQDAKKNPLTGEQKVTHAKNAFPGTNIQAASKEHPTILHHAANAHAAGAQHLHVVAGSDRHEEMHNLLHKYNGQKAAHGHYNFKSITVHSSGERDPDAEGTTGISASKMREHAASGNKAEFHKGAPSNMKPEHKDAMYNDVRKGMNIKEETTPYWKKPSFNKRMSQMAKQERKERERKEAEKTPVKEELRSDMGAAAYINDFIKSTNPRFNNKSKEERRKMAIGAFMAAKSRLKEGRGLADKYWSMAQDRKETADENKGNHEVYHTHMADHHDHMSRYHEELGQHTHAQSHADKAEIHHEKSMQKPNSKSTVKEGTLQGNIGGGDAMNTTTSAPSASTSKDTTMGKKIKGFKFFNGENDKQMNMNQPVKEEVLDEASTTATQRKDTNRPTYDVHSKATGAHIGTIYTPSKTNPKHQTTVYDSTGAIHKRGEHDSLKDAHDFIKTSRGIKEEKKDDVPFDGPYKSTFKKPNNPNRTGMDAARSLAQRAMDQLNSKKKENIKENEKPHPVELEMIGKTREMGVQNRARDAEQRMAKRAAEPKNIIQKVKKDIGGPLSKLAKGNFKGALGEDFVYNFDMLEEAVKSIDSGEYDYEGQMARTQLQTTLRNCQDLIGMIEDDENMPEWVQSKITLAQDYITTVRDYLQSKEELGEETLDERNKANALMRKTMDASRGAKFKLNNKVPDADPKHKTARDHNVAIGRALRNEATTGNPGFGYHGQHKTEHDADEAYKKIHAHVKSLTDSDDKTVKHYLDSAHGRHLVGHENDHDHIKKDFKKFTKYYKPEMHEATAQKGVNVDKVNHAGDTPHEEKWETAPKTVTKLKKVKEENMKSYKEFLQSLDEKLIGKQHKIDKNKNGEIDPHDFELLRKEEADRLVEYEVDKDGVYRHKGKSYGASYEDPEGAFETAADMKKADKKPAGRKTGQRTGSYKPRATMSKLKAAGSTYK